MNRHSPAMLIALFMEVVMRKFLFSIFSSPVSLLQVMSQSDIEEAIEEGDRIIINEDGVASVNTCSKEVKEDFARHVQTLRRV
jgi:hypothetical protein